MPEQLRFVAIAAAVCLVCVFIAAVLFRGRSPAKPAEPAKPQRPKKKREAKRPEAAYAGARSSSAGRSSRAPSPDLPPPPSRASLPQIAYDEDDAVEPTMVGVPATTRASASPATEKIVYDDDALVDEPTQSQPFILLSATAQTDQGQRRKRNEDSVLAMKEAGLFVVADGMGGYRGGEIASQLAVNAIACAFETESFPGDQNASIPRRASELARAIQAANEAVFARAQQERGLEGMGTTVCAVRFSPKKQRMYVGHVGDSRVYRLRAGQFEQMTVDHTMGALGVEGEGSNHLSRAVGLWPTVPIDILLGKPRPGDVYLLCSDGLTKMVGDAEISKVLESRPAPEAAAEELIRLANANGGKDNVSVVVVRVEAAKRDRDSAASLPN